MTDPRAPGVSGPPPWRIGAAVGVIALLMAGLVAVSRSDAGDGVNPAAAAPSRVAATAEASSESSSGDADRVLADTAEALAAWGVFAATGGLDEVAATFADGPQLAQLRSEAADRAASGPGPPPFDFAMSDSQVRALDGALASVRTTVTMTRQGIEPADFRWDIELRWDGGRGRWMLYTVATVTDE